VCLVVVVGGCVRVCPGGGGGGGGGGQNSWISVI